jgi:hypothetical protein
MPRERDNEEASIHLLFIKYKFHFRVEELVGVIDWIALHAPQLH